MRYRPDLDGLRAFAVLAVITSHAPIGNAGGGWMGVDVFFVLSGYLITAVLLAEHDHAGRIGLGRFYIRRALRLYPALLLVIAAGAIFYRDLSWSHTPGSYGLAALNAGAYVTDLTMGFGGSAPAGLSHTWSLAIEEQFYLIWAPVLIWLLARGRDPLRWAAAGTLTSWVLLTVGSQYNGPYAVPSAYFLPWDRFGQLLLGCCVAVALTRSTPPAWTARPVIGWGLALAAVTLMLAGARAYRYPHLWCEAIGIAVITAGLLLHLDRADRGVRSVLAWGPVAWVGHRSYGLYLYHYPVIFIVDRHMQGNRFAVFAVEVATTSVIALASYQLVELPFLRLKHRRFEPASHRPEPIPT